MERTLRYLFAMLWGALPALLLFLLFRPLRLHRLKKKRLSSALPREAALALFWMFCGGMAMVTLTPYWVSSALLDLLHGYGWNAAGAPFFRLGRVNPVPFKTFYHSSFAIYNLIGNVVMFIPFGLFPALLCRRFRWYRALLAGVGVTGFIECWQLLVGRAFDIDDLMLNTLGVQFGFCLALAAKKLFPASVRRLRPNPI